MQLDCQVLASLFYEELKAMHSGRGAHRAPPKARIVLINAHGTSHPHRDASRDAKRDAMPTYQYRSPEHAFAPSPALVRNDG
jgi:hypothetical protein